LEKDFLTGKTDMNDYLILLYYCYTKIEDPEDFREKHHLLCLGLNLRGRVIVASEGINGTLSGLRKDCETYMETMKSDQRFDSIEFKIEAHHENGFQKLHVRLKDEIVHSGFKNIDPKQRTGKYIEPAEFRKLKDSDEVVILDVRSNYEHNIGRFKNAVTLDMENFRDFPGKIKELEQFKTKKVITYCTGGIKCEKASAFLLEQGFKDVYQLHGGIIKYGIEEQGEDFEGKCYVFDNRVAVEINKINPKIVSNCIVCGKPSDRMVNCANPECNKHAPMCEDCGHEMEGACSEECRKHPAKREYNDKGYYPKQMNGYNPYKGWRRQEM
jgi:UPF0176 protein